MMVALIVPSIKTINVWIEWNKNQFVINVKIIVKAVPIIKRAWHAIFVLKAITYTTTNVWNVINIAKLAHHSVGVLHASLKINNQMSFKYAQDVIKDFMNRMRNVYHSVVMALKLMMNNVMMEIPVHQMVAVNSA